MAPYSNQGLITVEPILCPCAAVLDDWTAHHKRQRLENQQKEIYELKSLADLVRCSLCKDIELDDAEMAVMRALAS